ncbi:MAG: MgtC/SapB family protein [Hydrogenophaga sp.]|uniref:MgtC/SapB family protein n=1 Tax=Hydrogenophaga sp. TaxID=1904254 RepID=UPI003D0B3FE5
MFDTSTPSLVSAATTLAVALGCGLLIGVERERRKGRGPGRALAGLRSFALVCVTGAAAALTQITGLVVAGAAFVAALGVVAYWRDRSDDPGVTTEVALLLTYLIGVLCTWSLPLAAALAAGLTALLAGREPMHRFVSHWLRPAEVRDGIVLAALVLLGLPLMPDRPLWGPVLNPHVMVQLLALLLAVQSLAHLGRRLLQARHAVALSSLASGFVSSTATIASLGLAVREGREGARLMAGGGLLSCVSTQLQLLLVAAAVQPAWLTALWVPALASALLAVLWGAWLVRGAPAEAALGAVSTPRMEGLPSAGEERMFSLKGAAAVAALLTGIQVLVHAMALWLGAVGLYVGTLMGALADLHAALAAVFASSPPGAGASLAVMLALVVHALSKSFTAGLVGGARYLAWLAPGLWAHTLLGVTLIALVRS